MILPTIITLPNGFVASTTATMSDLFTDLSPYLILVLGILLASLVISIIISALKS
jgi:hypothetical protein